jgi:hypothetical protein
MPMSVVAHLRASIRRRSAHSDLFITQPRAASRIVNIIGSEKNVIPVRPLNYELLLHP